MSKPTATSTAQPTTVVVATGNPGKLAEMRALLGPGVRVRSATELGLELPEETGTTFEENALLKAQEIARQSGEIAIADDSGLVVEALDGRPGVYSARYAGPGASDAANRRKLLEALDGVPDDARSARFVSVIAIAFGPDDVVTAEGLCEGTIGREERGSGGFGYDSLFVLPDGRTMAELAPEEKNRISHRARAMQMAVPMLRSRLAGRGGRPQPSTSTEGER